MRVELLYFDDCPNYQTLLPHLRGLIAEAGLGHEVDLRRVATDDDARRMRFLGSPTVRVDGADVEPGAGERDDFGLKCRLYHTPEGIRGVPPDELILSALKGTADGGGSNGPSAAEHST
jgi:hypothetical protein